MFFILPVLILKIYTAGKGFLSKFINWFTKDLSPFSTHVFRRRWRNFSLAKKLFSILSCRQKDENFQRLDQQNKYLQRRMNVKNYFYVKIFRRRRRNDEVENGLNRGK